MVSGAAAPQPTRPDGVGAVLAVSRPLDSERDDSTPPSQSALRRQASEVGAVCSNSARRDLCGGHRATDVPTATHLAEVWSSRLDRFGLKTVHRRGRIDDLVVPLADSGIPYCTAGHGWRPVLTADRFPALKLSGTRRK